MWIAINGTACWTALLLSLQVVWREKKERVVYLFYCWKYTIYILVIYQKYQNVDESVHNCSEKISNLQSLFNCQSVGTPIINEWTGIAVLCRHGKSRSYIPTSKVIKSCNYGQISLRISHAFWSSILIKCKYTCIKSIKP